MGIVWTIIIGFVAGLIAKLITPGRTNPPALSSHHLGLSVRSWPLGWAKPWVVQSWRRRWVGGCGCWSGDRLADLGRDSGAPDFGANSDTRANSLVSMHGEFG